MNNLYYNYGEFYDEECRWWWAPEVQFLSSIKSSNLFYFDYLQNSHSFKGGQVWINDYHGTEKYDKNKMKTYQSV
jgi:hypothetical protein